MVCFTGVRPAVCTENRGAPRIHGELLKLGFALAQSSVAKYMVNRRGLPSQGWHTFLRNHAPDIAAMDLFVVPTMVWINVAPMTSPALARISTHAHALNRRCRIIAPCWERKCRSSLSFQHDSAHSCEVHPRPDAASRIQWLRRANALSAIGLAKNRQSDAARIV
jgi:hypothetical protein